jgi:short-subunit dehydrogenase
MRSIASKVLITGGAGGIGRAIAARLLKHGSQVLLVDRDERSLRAAQAELSTFAGQVEGFAADLSSALDRNRLGEHAKSWRLGIDTLINNAGLNPFGLLASQTPQQIDAAIAVNVGATLHLCHELLPHLLRQRRASILNMGSVFGSIGYPGYTVYSATKFAVRGFTEALRRELSQTNVRVHYLAPRATRTPINPSAVEGMNAELGVAMDSPDRVAFEVLRLLGSGRPAAVVGWPEKLYVRLNALVPTLIDRSVRKQLPVIERYARPGLRSGLTDPPADLRSEPR